MIHELQDVITWMLERMPKKGFSISFEQPTQQWAARLQKATVNVFLYDIRDNPVLQPRTFTRTNNGQGEDRKVVEKRSPLRMDCFYLITAWGIDDKKAQTEQHLLSQCIMTLAHYPVINPSRIYENLDSKVKVLREDLERVKKKTTLSETEKSIETIETKEMKDQIELLINLAKNLELKLKTKSIWSIQQEIRARLAGHDVLPNPAEIWSSLATPIRPSLSYVVNLPMNPWESDIYPETYHEVLELTQRLGRTEWRPIDNDLMPIEVFHRKNGEPIQEQSTLPTIVHGNVIDKRSEEKKQKAPVKVYLIDCDDGSKSRLARIDEQGRFVFTYVPLGNYKLQLWTGDSNLRQEIENLDIVTHKDDTKKKPKLPTLQKFDPIYE